MRLELLVHDHAGTGCSRELAQAPPRRPPRRAAGARGRPRRWCARRPPRCPRRGPRPVAITSPSATAGEEAARRSIAPSISTCSAPSSSIASLTARTSAAALGPATSTAPGSRQPRDHDFARAACARRSAPAARARRRSRAAARRSSPRGCPPAACMRGLSMRASITSCSSPSRPTDVTPTGAPGRRELAQDRRQRLGLARVLGQPDERQRARAGEQLAQPCADALAIRAAAAAATPRRRRGRRMRGASARASSRTMKLATWCG